MKKIFVLLLSTALILVSSVAAFANEGDAIKTLMNKGELTDKEMVELAEAITYEDLIKV